MKAVLVIDMPDIPKNCRSCPLNGYYCEYSIVCRHYQTGDTRPSLCPLRPLPNKLELRKQEEWLGDVDRYEVGFNACIDKITGETE